MSRAADAHLILRQHEQRDAAVLEAVVRSFAPVDPVVLRWQFPVWTRADDLDPEKIKGRGKSREEVQAQKDADGVQELLSKLPATVSALEAKLIAGRERIKRLINICKSKDLIGEREIEVRGNKCYEYFKL